MVFAAVFGSDVLAEPMVWMVEDGVEVFVCVEGGEEAVREWREVRAIMPACKGDGSGLTKLPMTPSLGS